MKYLKIITLVHLLLLFSFLKLTAQESEIDSLIQLVKNAGEDTIAVDAFIELGKKIPDDPGKQFLYLDQALKLSLRLDYKIGVGKSYLALGLYYTTQSDFEQAIKYLDRASDIFKELERKDMEIATLGNMGNVHCYLGDFEKGLECFLDALDVMYEIGDQSWIATAKNNIGSVYTLLEEDSIALEYYYDALSIYKEVGDEDGMSLTLGNLGNVYKGQKKYELAIEHYLQAVALDEKTGNTQQTGRNFTNLATAYGNIQDNENAIKYFEEAVSVFENTGNKNGLSVTYLTLSFYYRDINDFKTAKKYLKLSCEISKEIGAKHTLMNVYKEMSYHDSIDGNFYAALDNYMKYSDIKDTIFKAEKSDQIVEMQTKFDTEQKEKENELLKEKNARSELINQKKNILIIAVIGVLILMLIIGIIVIRISRLRKRTNKELEEKNFEINQQKEEIITQNEVLNRQNIKIEKSHKKITDSINYASRIQEAMLPAKVAIDQFLPDNFIFFKPRDVVSGDFYWIKEVKKHLVIVVADCTGHGVPGALVSMLGMSLLNDIVNNENITKANQVLEELRSGMKKSFKQTGTFDEQKDGMDLALCAINLETELMQYSGANIPLYHFRNNELKIYKPVTNPIGISHKEISFENHEIQLQNDDLFYMFSDGIIDQFHHQTNEKFKSSGLKKLLEKVRMKPMSEQYAAIDQLYNEWTGDVSNQTDDIILMGFKV